MAQRLTDDNQLTVGAAATVHEALLFFATICCLHSFFQEQLPTSALVKSRFSNSLLLLPPEPLTSQMPQNDVVLVIRESTYSSSSLVLTLKMHIHDHNGITRPLTRDWLLIRGGRVCFGLKYIIYPPGTVSCLCPSSLAPVSPPVPRLRLCYE